MLLSPARNELSNLRVARVIHVRALDPLVHVTGIQGAGDPVAAAEDDPEGELVRAPRPGGMPVPAGAAGAAGVTGAAGLRPVRFRGTHRARGGRRAHPQPRRSGQRPCGAGGSCLGPCAAGQAATGNRGDRPVGRSRGRSHLGSQPSLTSAVLRPPSSRTFGRRVVTSARLVGLRDGVIRELPTDPPGLDHQGFR